MKIKGGLSKRPRKAHTLKKLEVIKLIKEKRSTLASMAQVVGACSRTPRGGGFNSLSGLIPEAAEQSLPLSLSLKSIKNNKKKNKKKKRTKR